MKRLLVLSVLVLASFCFANGINNEESKSSAQDQLKFNRGYYTLFYDSSSKQYIMREGKDSSGIAVGMFHDDIETQGWGQLWVAASNVASVEDEMKAYGVGYLEGALTQSRIWDYWRNIMGVGAQSVWGNDTVKGEIVAWLMKQQTWARQNVRTNSSSYWKQVGLIQTQLYGMLDGYNKYAPKDQQFKLEDLVLLNSFPDSLDIVNVVHPSMRPNWLNMTKEDAIQLMTQRSHCSSLVKLHSQGKETTVMAGHTTWVFYSMLVRIFKFVTLPFKESSTVNPVVTYSSYPGQIVSADDFYTLGDSMVVMETSDNIFNSKLYEKVTPQCLLSWQRTALANRMAHSGQEWANIFGQYNSGTYNNQWIVVDYRKVDAPNGLLWIAEQIPGKVTAADQTKWLRTNSYWGSYNIPFYEDIYIESGYQEMFKKFGNEWSWAHCPRADIFRRNETQVNNMNDMRAIMRYNNYRHDPLEGNNPMWAIASRGDLQQQNPSPFGGLDSKITSNRMQGASFAICGPTHVDLPPFEWTGAFLNWPHYGQPKVWNFDWVHMTP